DQNTNLPFSVRVVGVDGKMQGDELAKGWSSAFSPDGKYVLYSAGQNALDLHIRYRETAGGPERPLVDESRSQFWPRVSPDGRYVAYASSETGDLQVFVKRFPGGEGKWQISVDGGAWPHWSARGDRLWYARGDSIMEVAVSESPSLKLGEPVEVLRRRPLGR